MLVTDLDPAQRGSQENSVENPPSIEPPNGRGGERFNWKLAGIVWTGYILGGVLSENVARYLLVDASTTWGMKELVSNLAFAAGGTITGFVIPVSIYNRAHHRSWIDTWRKIIS